MSSTVKPSVSVIIPTFNGHRLLEQHLPSVIQNLSPNDELLVIDDASNDETTTWLRHGFSLNRTTKPSYSDAFGEFEMYQGFYGKGTNKFVVTVLKNSRNLRFAASINRAVHLSQHPLLFLLNNDVSLDKDCLSILRKEFEKADNQALFAVAPLEFEGPDQLSPRAGKNHLFFKRGIFMHSKSKDFLSGDTSWVSGGSGLFSKEKYLELNGFDLNFYPAYWEDIDLSYRANLTGWKVLFNAQAVVYHQHESTNIKVFSQSDIDKVSWKHAQYFTLKHGSWWQKFQYFVWKPYWWQKRKNQIKLERREKDN